MTTASLVSTVATGFELLGVAVMAVGGLLTGAFAARDLRRREGHDVYRAARQRVGRSILLGLELLVASDIIRTVSEIPSLMDIAKLAAIVAIRTFLSFTLEIELTGRLPWRGTTDHAESRDPVEE